MDRGALDFKKYYAWLALQDKEEEYHDEMPWLPYPYILADSLAQKAPNQGSDPAAMGINLTDGDRMTAYVYGSNAVMGSSLSKTDHNFIIWDHNTYMEYVFGSGSDNTKIGTLNGSSSLYWECSLNTKDKSYSLKTETAPDTVYSGTVSSMQAITKSAPLYLFGFVRGTTKSKFTGALGRVTVQHDGDVQYARNYYPVLDATDGSVNFYDTVTGAVTEGNFALCHVVFPMDIEWEIDLTGLESGTCVYTFFVEVRGYYEMAWGDGSTGGITVTARTVNSGDITGNTHTYATPGTYRLHFKSDHAAYAKIYSKVSVNGTDTNVPMTLISFKGRYLPSQFLAINQGPRHVAKNALKDVQIIESQAIRGLGSNLTELRIPESLQHIADYGLGVNDFTSLYLPDALRYIGHHGFASCVKLASVRFPNGPCELANQAFEGCAIVNLNLAGVTKIGSYAFGGDSAMKTAVMPSIDYVASNAFNICTSLESVTFGSTPSYIDSTAFSGCTALTDIYVSWSEGAVANAPWGAPSTVQIHYDWTPQN